MTKLALILDSVLIAGGVSAASIQIAVHADEPGKAISPDLFGVFFGLNRVKPYESKTLL